MPAAITNKAANPPTAIPAMAPALRPLDSDGLEVVVLEGVLEDSDEMEEVEEILVDAG